MARIDFAYPDRRLAIELDGFGPHTDRFQHDGTRQNRLGCWGWTGLRFTWADAVERPTSVVSVLAAAYSSSKPAGGSITTRPGSCDTTNVSGTRRSPPSTSRSDAGFASTASTVP